MPQSLPKARLKHVILVFFQPPLTIALYPPQKRQMARILLLLRSKSYSALVSPLWFTFCFSPLFCQTVASASQLNYFLFTKSIAGEGVGKEQGGEEGNSKKGRCNTQRKPREPFRPFPSGLLMQIGFFSAFAFPFT